MRTALDHRERRKLREFLPARPRDCIGSHLIGSAQMAGVPGCPIHDEILTIGQVVLVARPCCRYPANKLVVDYRFKVGPDEDEYAWDEM